MSTSVPVVEVTPPATPPFVSRKNTQNPFHFDSKVCGKPNPSPSPFEISLSLQSITSTPQPLRRGLSTLTSPLSRSLTNSPSIARKLKRGQSTPVPCGSAENLNQRFRDDSRGLWRSVLQKRKTFWGSASSLSTTLSSKEEKRLARRKLEVQTKVDETLEKLKTEATEAIETRKFFGGSLHRIRSYIRTLIFELEVPMQQILELLTSSCLTPMLESAKTKLANCDNGREIAEHIANLWMTVYQAVPLAQMMVAGIAEENVLKFLWICEFRNEFLLPVLYDELLEPAYVQTSPKVAELQQMFLLTHSILDEISEFDRTLLERISSTAFSSCFVGHCGVWKEGEICEF